jgi:tellurite resistance protein
MGTAIVGIVGYQNPGNQAGLRDGAHSFGVFVVGAAAILAIALGVPYLVRWLRHPQAAIADLRNPVAGALYGTFPGGLLVLAVGVATVGPSLGAPDAVTTTVAVLATIGIVLAFTVSVGFAYLLFALRRSVRRRRTARGSSRRSSTSWRLSPSPRSSLT